MSKRYSPRGLPVLLAAALLMVSAGLSGCWDGSALRGRNTSGAGAPPTPEERFALVLETFRRGIETGVGGVSSGFVTNDEGTRSRFTVNIQVSSELFAPEDGDEPYRATITVTSLASYSLMRDIEEQKERPRDRAKEDSAVQDPSGLFPGANGIDVLDHDLIAVPTDQRAKPGRSGVRPFDDPVIRPHIDEDVRHYHLIYDNGRWRLTDETAKQFDESTEQAVIGAFQEALKTQG